MKIDIFGVKSISDVKGFKLFEDPNLPQDMKIRIKNGETVYFETSFDFEKVKGRNLYKSKLYSCIDLDVHISPIISPELLTLIGYVVHIQDITERKKRQLELAREKDLCEILINKMPCVAILLKPRTREIIASNKHAVKVGAIPGEKYYETWGQSQEPCFWCLAPKAWETGKDQHLEIEALDAIWDAYWIPITDDIYLHYAFDITERKKADIVLRQRTHDLNERVKELKCLYGVSLLLNDSQKTFDEINYEILKLILPGWQYPVITVGRIILEGKEYTSDNFYETPWMQSADFEILGKKSGSIEIYYLKEMPEEDYGPFLKEEQELIEAICRELTDFIKRKHAEKALQESELHLKEAQNIAQVGHWRLDPETKKITGSDELFRIFGLNQKEVSLDKFLEIVHPDDREFDLFHIRRGIEQGLPWDIEHRLICKDGSLKYVQAKGESSINKTGKAVHLMGTVQDITERKKTEIINKDLEHRRETFVWMTSHELRTPLTVISCYADFLLENINQIDNNQQNKILVTIKSNINRLMKLTEQVSQIAQFNNGIFEIKNVEFNICIFLNEALKPYKTILKNQIDLEGCSSKTPVIIEGDKDRLLQVLDNLLNNAIKHTHSDNRMIKINLETQTNSILIKIIDNGAGIAQRNIKRIFEQFVSIETEYSVTGTGIGLYVSKKIIEAHKGTLIAQSEGLGRGATFTIELLR